MLVSASAGQVVLDLDDPANPEYVFGWQARSDLVAAEGGLAFLVDNSGLPPDLEPRLLVYDFSECVGTPPAADFSWTPTRPSVDEEVLFTDTSTGLGVLRRWDFGDGTASTRSRPVHAFDSRGRKRVSLTVTNSVGNSTVTKLVPVGAVHRRPGGRVGRPLP
jgi:PKD repeat protein